jgi:endonuclease-3
MMTFSQRAALLQKVRRACRKRFGKPVAEQSAEVPRQLMWFILLEESSEAAVREAIQRIDQEFVDLNELRVSLAKEIAQLMRGVAHAQRKAVRLTKLFNAMFLKHNRMDWDFLRSLGVRELRQYFERADGGDAVLGAAAVMMFSAGHAVPADADVRRVLGRLQLIEPEEDAAAVQGFLERAVTREHGYETWASLRRVAESACKVKAPSCSRCPLKAMCPTGEARLKARRKSGRKPTAKKTAKQRTATRRQSTAGRKSARGAAAKKARRKKR